MKIKFCPNCPQPQYNKNILGLLYELALTIPQSERSETLNGFVKEYEQAINEVKGGIK